MRYLIRSAIVMMSSPLLLRELDQFGHTRHRAVFVHDFADDTGGIEPRDARDRRRLRSAQHVPSHRRCVPAGGTCGRTRRSCGLVAGSIAVITVAARSACRNAGRRASLRFDGNAERGLKRDVFCATISGTSSSSSRSGSIDRHTRPRPYFAMKLMASGITFSLPQWSGRPHSRFIVDDDDHLTGTKRRKRVFGFWQPDLGLAGTPWRFSCVSFHGATTRGHQRVSRRFWAARMTYFPTMSNSRLTVDPRAARRRLVEPS